MTWLPKTENSVTWKDSRSDLPRTGTVAGASHPQSGGGCPVLAQRKTRLDIHIQMSRWGYGMGKDRSLSKTVLMPSRWGAG